MLHHLTSFALHYDTDCSLLGISPAGHLYVEEYHGADLEFIAQTCYDTTGKVLEAVDELESQRPFVPLTLPANSITPQHYPVHSLNYLGVRQRGLREPDRLLDWVQPLSIAEKMTLMESLKLSVPLGQIAGIAESRVLAQAALDGDTMVVCRRLRVAVVLPQVAMADDGLPYDYDTLPVHVAHLLPNAKHADPAWLPGFHEFYGVPLHRPQDCLVAANRLWLADGGDSSTGRRSQIHVWAIQP